MRSIKTLQFSVLIAVCAVLSACSGTKIVEIEDDTKYQPNKEEYGQAKVYTSDSVGTIEDLYGENSNIEQSPAYQEAVEKMPVLRYNIIYFEFDSAKISEEGLEILRSHAKYLAEATDVFITLEGHADKRGSEGYNLALGEQRAHAVKKILIAFGVPQSQLGTVSFGEEKPVVWGDTEELYQKNRRVEIIYQ